MSEISVKTGLPELPKENLFWRVGETKDQGIFSFTESGAYIAIVEIQEIRIDKVRYIPIPFYQIPFGVKTKTDIKEVTVVYRNITATAMVDSDDYSDLEEPGSKQIKQVYRVQADDLTPELILEHAELALIRYLEVTKSRGYLGDYPPKTLVGED